MDNFEGLTKYEQKHCNIILLENDAFILQNILAKKNEMKYKL